MNVVRMAMPGIRSRSFSRSSACCSLEVWRRMAVSMRVLMCWSGMSMYFTTCSRPAMASIISSEKFEG